jgi:hypothetical protein
MVTSSCPVTSIFLHLKRTDALFLNSVCSVKGFSAKQILFWCRENKKTPYLRAFSAAGRNNRREHQYQVWEEGYDNAVIMRERDLLIKLDYMHANPLQDKWALCENPEDYAYSSASHYLKDKEPAIPIVRIT